VFFLLKESELTPSGANLLDGRYAVFGYVTEGQDALGYMKVRLSGCWWTAEALTYWAAIKCWSAGVVHQNYTHPHMSTMDSWAAAGTC
jgi:hypothetical protein